MKTHLTSFLICINLISISCYICLASAFRTTLKRCVHSGEPCLLPDFSASNFSSCRIMLTVSLS